MKISFKVLTLFLIILACSCKKDIEEKQNKLILLTKPSGWLTLKVEEKSTITGGTWIDITNTMGVFDIDNLLIFDPWYVWAVNEGPLKFPGNAQIPYSGTWSFGNNESKIQFENGTIMEINELTETSLQTVVVTDGVTKRYTYKHP